MERKEREREREREEGGRSCRPLYGTEESVYIRELSSFELHARTVLGEEKVSLLESLLPLILYYVVEQQGGRVYQKVFVFLTSSYENHCRSLGQIFCLFTRGRA